MNKKKLVIWERELELPVDIMCYENEAITEIQKDAVEIFLTSSDLLTKVRKQVESYILQNQVGENKIDEVDNIFKYVMPKSLFVPRVERRTVAVLCNYKFDLEHGLAIVFEEEQLKAIGAEDIVI